MFIVGKQCVKLKYIFEVTLSKNQVYGLIMLNSFGDTMNSYEE
jgi:hypothetical protein